MTVYTVPARAPRLAVPLPVLLRVNPAHGRPRRDGGPEVPIRELGPLLDGREVPLMIAHGPVVRCEGLTGAVGTVRLAWVPPGAHSDVCGLWALAAVEDGQVAELVESGDLSECSLGIYLDARVPLARQVEVSLCGRDQAAVPGAAVWSFGEGAEEAFGLLLSIKE